MGQFIVCIFLPFSVVNHRMLTVQNLNQGAESEEQVMLIADESRKIDERWKRGLSL